MLSVELLDITNIKQLAALQDLEQMLGDKSFYSMALPDDEIHQCEAKKVWDIIETSQWLILRNDEKDCRKYHNICGYLRWGCFTSVAANVHGYLKPEYWGTSLSDEFDVLVDEWFRNNTNIHKLMVVSPRPCEQVLKSVARKGYEMEGVLIGAVLWRGKIENIIVMSKFIKRI